MTWLRLFIAVGLLGFLIGCQTGGADTAGALSSAAANSDIAATDEDSADGLVTDVSADDANANAPEIDANVAETESRTDRATAGDPVLQGVKEIARIRGRDGESAAVLAVFACYKKARDRSVTLTGARICAAQDFVVSREVISKRPANATGTGDRALLVSKRHAERIGALMQLKGMNQNQFNTFAAYLNAVAEPAYQAARKS